MRHIYIILLLMLACRPIMLLAENETGYLPSIAIRQGGVAKQDRMVELKMSVDLSNARIRTQHTVALTPVLVSADGNPRHKVYLRAQRLESVELPPYHNDSAQVIICHSSKNQQYDYAATVPYRRWMLDGRVEIREEVHGCTNCGEGKSEQDLLNGVLPTYIPDYRLHRIIAPNWIPFPTPLIW